MDYAIAAAIAVASECESLNLRDNTDTDLYCR